MTAIAITGPVSWNTLAYLDDRVSARPHTEFARRFVRTVGGTSAGKAQNLAVLGASVTLRTVVGMDGEAKQVSERLAGAGIALELLRSADGVTEQHLNLMDPCGDRVSIYLSAPGQVVADPALEQRFLQAAGRADALVVDLADHCRPVLCAGRELGIPIWCDLHDYDGAAPFHRDFLEAATVVFCSDERLADYRDFMAECIERGAEIVVCTHGARGASGRTRHEFVEVAALDVPHLVDTNGAGDAFFAGFLMCHLAGGALADAMDAGSRQAVACLGSPDLAPAV